MYVSIDQAHDAGLKISIERGKDHGKKFLVIQPEQGCDLTTLPALREELETRMGFSKTDSHSVCDDVIGLVHHLSIWTALKHLDRSET